MRAKDYVAESKSDRELFTRIMKGLLENFRDIRDREDSYIQLAKDAVESCDYIGGILYSAWAAVAMVVARKDPQESLRRVSEDGMVDVSRIRDSKDFAHILGSFATCLHVAEWDILRGERLYRRFLYFDSGLGKVLYDEYARACRSARETPMRLSKEEKRAYEILIRQSLLDQTILLKDAQKETGNDALTALYLRIAERRIAYFLMRNVYSSASVVAYQVARLVNLGCLPIEYLERSNKICDLYTDKMTREVIKNEGLINAIDDKTIKLLKTDSKQILALPIFDLHTWRKVERAGNQRN